MNESFRCSICGKTHAGLPTDQAYKLPDVVWSIPEADRAGQAKFTADLCQLGDRFFIRCILQLPFAQNVAVDAVDFGWGIWVEVAQPVFDRYLALYSEDGSVEPPLPGKIANTIPGYGDQTLGIDVLIQFRDKTERPSVHFPPAANCQLAAEQLNGIDAARYHEILAACRAKR